MSSGGTFPRRRLRKFFSDSTVFRWQKASLRADLIFTLPVAICLAAGVAIGHPAVGLISAGGAMNTGFGHKQCIDKSRLLPMIFVTLGMAFSGFLGVLIGHDDPLLVLTAALWGFGKEGNACREGARGTFHRRLPGIRWTATAIKGRKAQMRCAMPLRIWRCSS